jgi:hypothetical protein
LTVTLAALLVQAGPDGELTQESATLPMKPEIGATAKLKVAVPP